jgi:hypothetical protein
MYDWCASIDIEQHPSINSAQMATELASSLWYRIFSINRHQKTEAMCSRKFHHFALHSHSIVTRGAGAG